MADYILFFNPMSRAQIARWALHEVGADYETVYVNWDEKPQALLNANPIGKVPTLIHHDPGENHVVTEAAAICHYLAVQQAPELGPKAAEAADYFRWLFFAAGPLEQAITAHSLGWSPSEDQQAMAGFGNYERTIDNLDGFLSDRDYVCGERFTMADVYVGSQVDWGLAFGSIPNRKSFENYVEQLRAREAYKAAKAIDEGLIAEMQNG